MGRQNTVTTTDWQQVATGPVVVTILKRGQGTLFVNEAADFADANRFGSEVKANDQFQQFSEVDTFLRHGDSGKPWTLLINGALYVPPVVPSPGFGDGFGDGFD